VLFRGRQPAKWLAYAYKGESLADYVVLEDLDLLHGVVGVATESGELGEVILAHMNSRDPIDRGKMYARKSVTNFGICRVSVKWGETSLMTKCAANIRKLRARHTATGFDVERDKFRNLTAERAILETYRNNRVGAIERSIIDRIYPS